MSEEIGSLVGDVSKEFCSNCSAGDSNWMRVGMMTGKLVNRIARPRTMESELFRSGEFYRIENLKFPLHV